ncbi:MAG: type II secretion system protein [Patescibacteria group bacterium]
MKKNHLNNQRGYSLPEVLIVLLVFTGMFIVMLNLFQNSIKQLNIARAKIVAIELGNEQMEILRNLQYSDVGVTGSSPNGTIPASQELTRSNIKFKIETEIKYIDDPFDGCVGEIPGEPGKSRCADGTIVDKVPDIPANSNNPADYKKANIEISWTESYPGKPIQLSTIIAPKGLEGDTTKGFMLVTIFNSAGDPVVNADVEVINNTLVPAFDYHGKTDIYGTVQLYDLEPAEDSYIVKASYDAENYSHDQTCAQDDAGTGCSDSTGNPLPIKQNLTISAGHNEEISFAIDKLSNLSVNSYTDNCTALPNIDLTLSGDKKISQPPTSYLKNVLNFVTNGSGQTNLPAVEWDLYDLLVNTPGYDIAGVNHDLALNVLPDTSIVLNVLLAPHTSNSLLLTVKDNNGTNLSNASVRLRKADYDETKITGHGFMQQTDWLGGSGQENFIDDSTKYYSDNGNIDNNTSGEISLKKISLNPSFNETFDSSTYQDAANTTADWNTADLELKLPTVSGEYPVGVMHHAQTTIINSQHGRIVSATLNATEELNGQSILYFLSADGGTNFEPVSLGTPYDFMNSGSDLRWRTELISSEIDKTPIVKDFTVSYTLEYYEQSGELISSTFDLGSTADFSSINWEPSSQPVETGAENVKIQIATNNDNSTWNFTGPDGTGSTFYSINNSTINSASNGNRYVRYKAILSTEDVYFTPALSNLRIGYTQECFPPGQVFYRDLTNDTYSMEIKLAGFEVYSANVEINGYVTQTVQLIPTL